MERRHTVVDGGIFENVLCPHSHRRSDGHISHKIRAFGIVLILMTVMLGTLTIATLNRALRFLSTGSIPHYLVG